MGELIFFIVIVNFIVKAIKKSSEEQQKKNNVQNRTTYQMPKKNVRTSPAYEQLDMRSAMQSQEMAPWQKAAKENIEKARKRATDKLREIERELEVEDTSYKAPKQQSTTTPYWEMGMQTEKKPQEKKSAMQQVNEGRVAARNTTILERAKIHAEADKEDVTLNTMEAEHNHSERVSAAVHHHPEDVLPESMLGSVEDLMVKGYDGNLCFERDFVGEAMDMISRFTVPSDVPDFEKSDEVA